jgi:hypothetical protein
MKYLFLLIVLFCGTSVFAQYTYEWNMVYGTRNWEETRSIVELHDHSLVLVGNTQTTTSGKQLHILKVDEKGKKLWDSIYTEYHVSSAESVIETDKHEIVVAGYCIRKGQYFSDFLVIKFDQQGNIIWQKTYGMFDDEVARSITQTADGGFAITGYTDSNADSESDVWVVKIDAFGNQQWEYSFGGSKLDYANCIIQTKDNDLVVAGYTKSRGARERGSVRSFWVIKLDNMGSEKWSETYGESYWDIASSVVEGPDRSLYVTGYTKNEGLVNYDVLVIKVDAEGNKVWSKIFGDNEWEEGTCITTTYDGNILIGGFARSTTKSVSNFCLLKLDFDGNEVWNKVFKRESLDFAYAIYQTYDKGIVLAGTTFVDIGDEGWDIALLKFTNDRSPRMVFTPPNLQEAVVTSPKYKLKFNVRTGSQLDSLQVLINDTLRQDLFGDVKFAKYDTLTIVPSRRKKEEAKYTFFKSYDRMMQRIMITDTTKLNKYFTKGKLTELTKIMTIGFEKEYNLFSKENMFTIRATNPDGTRYSDDVKVYYYEFPWIGW